MTNIKHIEHPEDTILTGDLDVLGWFQSAGRLSVKIDGAPAIVWGLCPVTGRQFVGTKSVFNKKDPKICYNGEDVEHYYGHIPVLVHILQFCLSFYLRQNISIKVTGSVSVVKGNIHPIL